MKDEHAVPPTICADCMAACHELAKDSPGSVIKACRHTSNSVVLAIGFTAHGLICRWDLKGPLVEREAEQLALAYIRAFEPPVAAAPTAMQ